MFVWQLNRPRAKLANAALQAGIDADVGRDVGTAIEWVIDLQYQHVFDGYLAILSEQIRESLCASELSPTTEARSAFDVFCDRVDQLRLELEREYPILLRNWIGTANELGMCHEVDQTIAEVIDEFTRTLLLNGRNILIEQYGTALMAADRVWRLKGAK